MPDPKLKKKKSLDEMVTDAGNEVLGQSQSVSSTTMSDDDLLATFGESEKKKATPSSQDTTKHQAESQEQIPSSFQESTEILKPKEAKSGNGSLNQSGEDWEGSVGQISKKQSYLESANNALTRRLAELPADLGTALGTAGKFFNRIVPNPYGIPGDTPVADKLIADADAYRKWLDEINIKRGDPTKPITNSVAGAVADIGLAVATGGEYAIQKAIAPLTEASVAKAVLSKVGKQVAAPNSMIAATQIISGEYNQAIQGGATEDDAVDVALINGAAGSVLEGIPISQFFKRLDKVTDGGFKNYLKEVAINGAQQGFEEATTESLQSALSNYTAAETYDTTRKWYDGMAEGGGIGFGMGFLLGGLGVSLRKKQSIAQTPEEKAEIQKAIDFVDDKTDQLESGKLTDQGVEIQETPEQEAISEQEAIATEEQNAIPDDNTIIPADEALVQEQLSEDNGTIVEEAQQDIIEPTQEVVGQSTEELTAPGETINTEQIQEPLVQQEQVAPETIVTDTAPEIAEPVETEAIKKEVSSIEDKPSQITSRKPVDNYKSKIKELDDLYYQDIPKSKKSAQQKLIEKKKDDIFNNDLWRINAQEVLDINYNEAQEDPSQKIIIDDMVGSDRLNYINKIASLKDKIPSAEDLYSHYESVKNALEKSKFRDAIDNGEMTIDEAKDIVESVGLKITEVPMVEINTSEELEGDLIAKQGDINEIESLYENKEDVEIIKEYIDEKVKNSDKPIIRKGQEVEERSTEEAEGSESIRTIRDKVGSLKNIDEKGERDRLAREIISDIDNQIENIEPQEKNEIIGRDISFEKPDGTVISGSVIEKNKDGDYLVEGKNKYKYVVKEKDILTFNDSRPKETAVNTRSDASVSINANKGKTDINDMVGIAGINEFFGINVSDITKFTKKGKDFFQKWLTSRGFIPESVFKSFVGTEGNINAELSKMKYQIADFRRAIKKAYNLSFGQELSTTTKAEINSALGGNKESMANLPNEAQEAVSDMRAHIDYLSQRMIGEGIVTGDLVAKFQENMGIYMFRSFRKHDDPDWVQDIDPMIVNKAKGYIQQQYPDYTVDEVDGIINELLYTPDAPMHLIKTGKLGSKDLSILKKRKELAPEIRALYGEYTDPLVNYSKSIIKMINIIEKHKFLENVKSQGMGKFLFEKPTGNNSALIAGEKSSTMAPLNGLYTTPEIATAFEEFNSAANLPKWMEYYMKAISTVKSAKTVMNITTHARNIVGNIKFVVANGHYDILQSSDAFKTIKNDIVSADNKKFREAYQRYQKLGIVGDSSSAGELKAMLEDAKLKPDKFEYVNVRGINKAKKAVTQFIGDAYQAEDDFYKIYAFENEFKRYKEAYGDTKTDEEVEKIAADIVRNTYPTYSKTSRLIKEMRKAPVLGTFISFPAEVIRTTYNTAEIAWNELKSDNPKIKAIGKKRRAGIILSSMFTPVLAGITRYLYGISDEEEEKVRDFVAPWSKNSLFFYTGPIKDGKVNIIDLSQTDPGGFWQKPIISLLDGEDLEKGAIDAVKELLTPFFGLNMVTEALIDLKNNEKTTGQKITNPSLPLGDRMIDYASYIYDFAKPGTLNSVDRITKGATLKGEPDEYGKIYNLGDETLAALGGQRISSIDINKSFSFIARDLKDKLTQDKQIYTRFKLKEQSWMSPEEKEAVRKQKDEALNKATEATIKSVENMRKYYFGAIRLGVSKEAAKATLKENKIPKDITKLVFSEVPLEKMKVDWYVKGVNKPVSADEYIKMKIKD